MDERVFCSLLLKEEINTLKAGEYVKVSPSNRIMDGLGKVVGFADDEYENAEELGYYIVDFGNIYGTCTVHRDNMKSVGEDVYECECCRTVIAWSGADERRGELWSCEQTDCGVPFCVACFRERHGSQAWHEHINESSIAHGIMCPTCYGKNKEKLKMN